MRAMKQAGLGLLTLGVAVLCGCERHSNKEVFYLVTANAALPYWQTAAAGFNHAAALYKVTAKVVGPDGYDAQAELDALQKAVATKPAGILISTADAAVLQSGINAAIDAGIPVITVDSDDPGSRRLYFIGTNNLDAGRLGAKPILEKFNTANLIVFTIKGQPNTDDRLTGLKNALAEKPGIKIADVIDVKGDARVAFDRAQELLAETGPKKIDGFDAASTSASGKMVSDAIKRANATDRLLVAWDVNQDTLERVIKGEHHQRNHRAEALHHGRRGAEGSG